MGHRAAVVPIGPYHPVLKEPEFFKLYVDGEEVIDVDIRIGYNHRGIEKLSEKSTYHQVPFLVERVCGICSNIHPLCFVQAVEDIVGLEVPDRARFIRTITSELERIHSHLLWLGIGGHILGFDTLLMWAWKYREPILDLFELITGNRQHYAMNVIGGVRRDIKRKHVPKILKTMNELEPVVKRITSMIIEDPVTISRCRGIGVLTLDDAREYCVVGPTARGSGLNIDTRKDYPYAAYDEVGFEVPIRREGDVLARVEVRLLEISQSVGIIKQAVEQLPAGDIAIEVESIPPGEGIGMGEAPRGENIHYVKSNGTNMPERHKIRSPTYVNIPSLRPQLIGNTIADAMIIIASIDPCFSCTDRISIVDERRGSRKLLSGEELIRYWRKKRHDH